MHISRIHLWLAGALTALIGFGAGCAKQDGPYAEAKQTWDPPRSTEQLHDLRTRLATTQQDH